MSEPLTIRAAAGSVFNIIGTTVADLVGTAAGGFRVDGVALRAAPAGSCLATTVSNVLTEG